MVSTIDEQTGPIRLMGDGSVLRQTRTPHSKTVVWKLFDKMRLEGSSNELSTEAGEGGGKRKSGEVASSDRPLKKTKSMEELFGDWLAEWDDSVDGRKTYRGSVDDHGEEDNKEGEELLLNCLLG